MKNFLKSLKRQDGFTLVELMVVVAIIGLLSAVAIPNFKKYQAKAKTSEAKLQLSAMYTAMQSWYSDFDNYGNCLNLMGFDPGLERLSRYYAVGFPLGVNPTGNAASVLNGAPAACGLAVSVTNDATATTASNTSTSTWGAGKAMAGTPALLGAAVILANIPNLATPPTPTVAIPPSFRAGAIGYIDASKLTPTTADAWTVNENKRLTSERPGY
jgi:type IV pilus assembly protein PilA